MDTVYSTTDGIYLERASSGQLSIGFGPVQVHLTKEALQDLSYRISSFLVYLEGHKPPVIETELEESGRTKGHLSVVPSSMKEQKI